MYDNLILLQLIIFLMLIILYQLILNLNQN